MKKWCAALAASMIVLATAGCDAGGSDGPSIVVYNAQHEQLISEIAPDFTKKTGIKVELRNGSDPELAAQLDAGGRRVAGRRLPHRELPGDVARSSARACFAACRTTALATDPRAVPAARAACGPASSPARRCWSTTPSRCSQAELPDVAHGPRRPGVEGTDLVLAHRRGLPGDRRRRARAEGRGGDPGVARRPQGQRHDVRRQQRGARVGQRRPSRDVGIIYHYYWYRDQAESGDNSDNTEAPLLRQPGPRRLPQRLRRGRAEVEHTRDDAQKFVAYLTSEEGQKKLAASYALEYPLSPAASLGPPVKPFDELRAARRSTSPTSTDQPW